MRIAINCLAFPVLGRPTRRARFNSSFVDSGRSEKSICLFCIGFPFFRARAARSDDAKRFFAILQSPVRINQNDNAALCGHSESLEPVLVVGVLQVFPLEAFRIGKNCGRFLERNVMLFQVPGCFSSVPNEHNLRIYNKYRNWVKRKSPVAVVPSGFSGCLWKSRPFDWLTSILTGSIKILARAGFTGRANEANFIRAEE